MLRRAGLNASLSCARCLERVALAAQSRRQRHDDAGELYEALGIDRRATKEDVKQAFREVRRCIRCGSSTDPRNGVPATKPFLLTLSASACADKPRAVAQKAKQHHPDRHHGTARGKGFAQSAAFARILAAYQACRGSSSAPTLCAHWLRGHMRSTRNQLRRIWTLPHGKALSPSALPMNLLSP